MMDGDMVLVHPEDMPYCVVTWRPSYPPVDYWGKISATSVPRTQAEVDKEVDAVVDFMLPGSANKGVETDPVAVSLPSNGLTPFVVAGSVQQQWSGKSLDEKFEGPWKSVSENAKDLRELLHLCALLEAECAEPEPPSPGTAEKDEPRLLATGGLSVKERRKLERPGADSFMVTPKKARKPRKPRTAEQQAAYKQKNNKRHRY